MDDPITFLILAVLGTLFFSNAKAQTVVITNPQGNTVNYFQQAWGTVNTLDARGNVIAPPMTVQPNQLTMPSGAAIGVPQGYTVPPSPPSPPSPRVLQ